MHIHIVDRLFKAEVKNMEGIRVLGIHPAILISIGICFVILAWVLFKEKCIEALTRMVVGGIIIYCLNGVMPQYAVGINGMSLICSGILGIPGVAMLYIVGAIV